MSTEKSFYSSECTSLRCDGWEYVSWILKYEWSTRKLKLYDSSTNCVCWPYPGLFHAISFSWIIPSAFHIALACVWLAMGKSPHSLTSHPPQINENFNDVFTIWHMPLGRASVFVHGSCLVPQKSGLCYRLPCAVGLTEQGVLARQNPKFLRGQSILCLACQFQTTNPILMRWSVGSPESSCKSLHCWDLQTNPNTTTMGRWSSVSIPQGGHKASTGFTAHLRVMWLEKVWNWDFWRSTW